MRWLLPSGAAFQNITLVISAILLLSIAAAGQLAADIKWAGELTKSTTPANDRERAQLLKQVLDKLQPYRSADAQLDSELRVLELELELLQHGEQAGISDQVRAAAQAQHPSVRSRHLNEARWMILDNFAYMLSNLDPTKLSVADAQKISDFLKYTSQLLDDMRDPSVLGGRTSELTRLATRINGMMKLAQSIQDPDARRIMGGLRNTLGTIDGRIRNLGVSVPNTIKAFDIPAEVAAAIVDTTRKGFDESSAALNEVGKAIAGDATALDRLSRHAKEIETILSPQNYGRQMADALAKRVADRLPFVRTIANWLQTDDLAWLLGKWKYTGYHRNAGEEFAIVFRRGANGVSGFIVTPNSAAKALGFNAGDEILRNIKNDSTPAPYPRRAHAECLDQAGGRWAGGSIQFNSSYRILESDWSWCLTPVRSLYFRFEEGYHQP